jgi:hypothetical protein
MLTMQMEECKSHEFVSGVAGARAHTVACVVSCCVKGGGGRIHMQKKFFFLR